MSTILRELEHPVAITMWDFGWLLRHYEGGGFEDWDKALDELVERGYNAIRIDCFPHLVACDEKDEFEFPYIKEKCSIWHHNRDVKVNVKEALKGFLPKCFERGIYIGLSTWVQWPTYRPKLEEKEDLIKAWDKTMQFLSDNDLLHNILYVDFLNEYPFCHGFVELKRKAQILDGKVFKITETNMQDDVEGGFGEAGSLYLKEFSAEIIDYFNNKWPGYDYGLCITTNINDFHPEQTADFSKYGFFDMHLWFAHYPGWWDIQKEVDIADTKEKQKEVFDKIDRESEKQGDELLAWMDENTKKHYNWSKENNGPVGNTEGWGFVGWPYDTDNWTFIKQSAEYCIDMCIKYNYSFICTSNFTHPYFKNIWNDIEWHKKVTNKIKSTTVNRFWLK